MYYLVSDYIVPVYFADGSLSAGVRVGTLNAKREYYQREGIELPENYRLLSLDRHTTLSVVFYDVDQGRFLIRASSRRRAYEVLRSIQAFFSLFYGIQPRDDRVTFALNELRRMPRPTWTIRRLRDELRFWELQDLGTGTAVEQYRMQYLIAYLPRLLNDAEIRGAMTHLNLSRALFYGFMVGSYYESHYVYDRRELRRTNLEKRYFEHREKYELAFLAAFKGIERLLRVNQIKKNEIANRFDSLPYPNIRSSSEHRRLFEVFSGERQTVTYAELAGHFLEIRNVVAAHSNTAPPRKFFISEDSLYEIQNFLSELCSDALEDFPAAELPAAATRRRDRAASNSG